ncbi:hypothetical protein RNAN_0164 [Rheinheimera nanhaiensis E407-8]|uniref:Uncharacterized protein n=1 Tax=Rheinheimera nanhaiensis E407-8 TaxID=562729 RepID=I1DT23_9GAMM|nr:hypothetical protein RNAN_0164 [Rheinheimera nanhaiensis E407-8]
MCIIGALLLNLRAVRHLSVSVCFGRKSSKVSALLILGVLLCNLI